MRKQPLGRADYFSGGRLSGEEGTVIRDWGGRYPFALIYPNSYFIGMSNLGLQAMYSLLNNHPETIGERIFWENDARPLLSLESSRPLMDYACLAFSFSYELDYLNLASILKAGCIPLYSMDRDDAYPLLIAGGPCITANPMPLAHFFDALCIGEGEVILPDVLRHLTQGLPRAELLQKLADVPGVYVPALARDRAVKRRYLASLDDFPTHSCVLTHDTELGELYLIEAERGCSASCCFCLVSRAFCPLRFHSLDSLLQQAREGLKYRGRIGLVGPVVTDHPQIEELLGGLLRMGAGFSLSSIRLMNLNARILELMAHGGIQTLALAPEAGSQRLRRAIRKGFNEDDIMSAVDMVSQQPFKQLKLYFMLGLPSETDEDVASIIDLALRCQKRLGSQHRGCRLSLNVAPFVPKAGTPYQWFGMAPEAVLESRIACLRDSLSGHGIEVKAEGPQWSHVQAALSRGDDSFSEALANIDRVSLASWRRAAKKAGVNVEHFALNHWARDTVLPWRAVEL
ncbi:MAG: B12-binding domain-containing radical SAM protein [Dehalococcoidia bacterium]|nr:B12-binding domain-containing radical SAM protein [Dehalococcoidia bacterium]